MKRKAKINKKIIIGSGALLLLSFVGLNSMRVHASVNQPSRLSAALLRAPSEQTASVGTAASTVAASSSTSNSHAGTATLPASTTKATSSSASAVASAPAANTSAGSAGTTYQSQAHIAAPPLSGPHSLYTDAAGDVAVNARAWAASNPSSATAMNRLASTPMAHWFTGSDSSTQAAVNDYVSAAYSASEMPVVVAYNIPDRDCGGASGGGASDASAYQAWITQMSQGIAGRPAIVILEPDALAMMGSDCLPSGAEQQAREAMLASAVQTLAASSSTYVYLDAGNPNWQSTATMAARLSAADVSQATGFSLNVSNFDSTSSNTSYGQQISSQLHNAHFVIDTSRNGSATGAGGAWCNPSGQAFGNSPTLSTGVPHVDGYLWIKDPGESDGACGPSEAGTSAPSAGAWWPQYALSLEQDSGW